MPNMSDIPYANSPKNLNSTRKESIKPDEQEEEDNILSSHNQSRIHIDDEDFNERELGPGEGINSSSYRHHQEEKDAPTANVIIHQSH